MTPNVHRMYQFRLSQSGIGPATDQLLYEWNILDNLDFDVEEGK